MLLLLVQSPTTDHAVRANRLVNLGLVRLEGSHGVGLSGNYYLAQHVKEALGESL